MSQDEITQQDWRVNVYQSIAEIAQHEWDIFLRFEQVMYRTIISLEHLPFAKCQCS